MFGRIVGYATVVANPSEKTLYPFGPVSEIVGKRLPVLERNRDGDCLCLVDDGRAMADVVAADISEFARQ